MLINGSSIQTSSEVVYMAVKCTVHRGQSPFVGTNDESFAMRVFVLPINDSENTCDSARTF